jgi:hypothetical protein
MKTRKREAFPRVTEILATAAAHAELEAWSLRKAVDWIQLQLERHDPTAAKAVQDILDATDENREQEIEEELEYLDRDEWEGRNNG